MAINLVLQFLVFLLEGLDLVLDLPPVVLDPHHFEQVGPVPLLECNFVPWRRSITQVAHEVPHVDFFQGFPTSLDLQKQAERRTKGRYGLE